MEQQKIESIQTNKTIVSEATTQLDAIGVLKEEFSRGIDECKDILKMMAVEMRNSKGHQLVLTQEVVIEKKEEVSRNDNKNGELTVSTSRL